MAKKPDLRPVTIGRASLDPLPGPGAWLFTCREGFERDLIEELTLASKSIAPRVLTPSLVATGAAPPRREGRLELTFARQGFPVAAAHRMAGAQELAESCARSFQSILDPRTFFTLQAWVPDSTDGNRLSGAATELAERVEKALLAIDPALSARRRSGEDVRHAGGTLAQLCLAAPGVALVGALPFGEALSPFPGGRARMRVSAAAPSRAAMKLEEALEWFGFGPEPGDLCVDLGAAPGGWTFVLLERRARVIAVDPGRLAPEIARRKGVSHVLGSAFNYEPREPVDWLFCDMAWRPLEVAALLAKWGRRRLARTLVANIKLPMKQKAEFVQRVRRVVESGGWRDVRTRHLYHDRDEVTLAAWRS